MEKRLDRKSIEFEVNPCARRRIQNKLLRRIRRLIAQYCISVGEQAALVTYTRRYNSNDNYSSFIRVFGSQPLESVLSSYRSPILHEMSKKLPCNREACAQPSATTSTGGLQAEMCLTKKDSANLPPLEVDGIPTPLQHMTQAQLRAFVPLIVKVSSKGERPKWGKESEKPLWWPTDIPWASVKTDPRASVEEKRKLSWTEALRKIIISCYQFYGRQDLLDASDIKSGQWRKALQIADMNISLDDCSLDEIGMEQSSEEDETELVTNGKRKKSTKGTGGKSRKKKFVETSGSPVGNSHRSTPTPTTCVLPGIQIVCGGSGSGLDHMDKIEFHRESPTSSTEKPETTSEDSQSPQHFEPTLFLNNSTEDVPKERVNDTRTPQRHVEIEGELYAMSETSDLLTKISSPPILYIRDGVPLRFVQMSENANDQFPEPSETLL